MDKLAIEILKDKECALDMDYSYGIQLRYGITIDKIVSAMQAYHEAKLKKEIIKCIQWIDDNYDEELANMNYSQQVDEYLKQRNNEYKR